MVMTVLADNLRSIGRGLAASLKDYPLEAMLGITYFIIFAIGGKPDILVWFFPHYVLLYTLHKFSRKGNAMKILYVLAWFLWIPLILWKPELRGWDIGIAYLIALILLIIGEKPLGNEEYGRNILDIAIKVALGFLIGGLLMGIVTAIIASVGFLFDLELSDNWFTHPNAFIATMVIPLLCCWSVSRPQTDTRDNKFIQIAIDYILSPALVIYAVILYAYIARILFRWELPNGGVAYLVLTFTAIAMLCHLFRLQLSSRHFDWFYKAFPIIAIPPLILLWAGVIRRITEYGITETRFYLLLLVILVTVFVAMLPKERTRNFQLMTLIFAITGFLFTFIPGIRARDFETYSQKNRPVEQVEGPEDGLTEAVKERIWSVKDIQGPIDLGEYSQLVPASEYHYYEDSSKSVFYKDESRTEILLECDIIGRLHDNVEDPADKLVYRNDRYMAVFSRIDDKGSAGGPAFTTSYVMLLRKP